MDNNDLRLERLERAVIKLTEAVRSLTGDSYVVVDQVSGAIMDHVPLEVEDSNGPHY